MSSSQYGAQQPREPLIEVGPTESEALGAAGLPDHAVDEIKQDEAGRIPLGRRGEPGEVASWLLHLADPKARWLTGQVVTLDGGLELV